MREASGDLPEDAVVIGLDGQMFAAVDPGSNSFHMIVARDAQERLEVIDRLREMVQLAAGLDADGNLTQEARVCRMSTIT